MTMRTGRLAGNLRLAAGLATFAVVALAGILATDAFAQESEPGDWFNRGSADAFAVVLAVAMIAGALVTFGLELRQTGRLDSIAGQFTTRTFVLMPVAIALNAVLGATLATTLRLPLYLDSIGTVLVAVLCGPVAGALTGGLSNVLRSTLIPPPFADPAAGAFAVVSVTIGLTAGSFARLGWFRPRPARSSRQLITAGVSSAVVLAVMGWYGYTRFYADDLELFGAGAEPLFVGLGLGALALVAVALGGYLYLLAARRDAAVAWVVVAGVIVGAIAALVASPIAANVFGGVTGSGVDFLVAAFRQAGADIGAATLQQSLLVDPIDKMLSSLIVYLVVAALALRTVASFPQGERLVPAFGGWDGQPGPGRDGG